MTKNSLGAAMAKAASLTPQFGRTEPTPAIDRPVPSMSQEPPAISPSKTQRPPSRVGKKAISGYFDPGVSRQLARLAIDQGRSNEDLLREALNDLFTKYQLPPIA